MDQHWRKVGSNYRVDIPVYLFGAHSGVCAGKQDVRMAGCSILAHSLYRLSGNLAIGRVLVCFIDGNEIDSCEISLLLREV